MMNTVNYKVVSVVSVNDMALAMTLSASKKSYTHIKKVGASNIVNNLVLLRDLLGTIDNNDNITNEPMMIVLWHKSPIVGFAIGSFVDYIRTGRTNSGRVFTEEEMALIRECAELYANKCLNVRITTDEFISNKDRATKTLIDCAWKQVKIMAQQMKRTTTPATTPVANNTNNNTNDNKATDDTDKDDMIAKQQQMIDELMAQNKAMLDAMSKQLTNNKETNNIVIDED